MKLETENKLDFKDKLSLLYKNNKLKIIFSIILIFVIFFGLIYINEKQKKKNILQAENFIKAGIFLSNGEEKKALVILEEIIESRNKFYSILALNLILEKSLVDKKEQILDYFETMETIKYSKNASDIINLKKALFYLKNLNLEQGNNLLQKLIDNNSNQKDIALEIIDK